MNLPTIKPSNGSNAPGSCLQQSVQTFFGAVNWEDSPPEVQEIKLTAAQDGGAGLSLTLSVCQFFAAVNWEDAQIAAPSLVELPTSPTFDNLTLDDFSSLF